MRALVVAEDTKALRYVRDVLPGGRYPLVTGDPAPIRGLTRARRPPLRPP